MPLELHVEARRRLIGCLAEELGNIRVNNGRFIDVASSQGLARLDDILPGPQTALRQQLESYVGEKPASMFVFEEISRSLFSREFDASSDDAPLSSVEQYSKPEVAAEELITHFASLPWQYTLFLPVDQEIGRVLGDAMGGSEYWFDSRTRLVTLGATVSHFPPTPRRGTLLTGADPRPLDANAVYFSADVDGYIGLWGMSRPLEDFILAIRSYHGLAIAHRVARSDRHTFFAPKGREVMIYRRDSSRWHPEYGHSLEPLLATKIASVGCEEAFMELDPPVQRAVVGDHLAHTRSAFSSTDRTRFLGAAQWLFDSFVVPNRLIAFVQATIALEILLGDKALSDIVGLGELLANRCAYLVGESAQQRRDILRDFRRIYDTRSKIVHRGKSRLTLAEEADLARLRWLAMRAMREELMLAVADGHKT